MFSAFSCSVVVLCWVIVDIFVLLDFFSMSVLLHLHFNTPEYKISAFFLCGKSSHYFSTLVWLVILGLYFKLYFFNFCCTKTFLLESSFAFISVLMAWYWLWLAFLSRELSVFFMSCAALFIVFSKNCTMSFINNSEICFCLKYQLSKNSWSLLTIVGSSVTSSPLRTSSGSKSCLFFFQTIEFYC